MTPNFALSLSFDGLRLMHRASAGWELVGEAALDSPDLTAALAQLRADALALEPGGLFTKLLLPNDQIKYLALDTTRAERDDILAALDGTTPYALADLAFDYSKGGGRTYVAAVALETLAEAEAFAVEHQFNPVCFVGVPDPFTFVGEPYFGATSHFDGTEVERDTDPVVVIGHATIPARTPIGSEAPEAAATEPDVEAHASPTTDPAPAPAEERKPEQQSPSPEAASLEPDMADMPVFGTRREADPEIGAPLDPVDQTAQPPDDLPIFDTRRDPSLAGSDTVTLTATPELESDAKPEPRISVTPVDLPPISAAQSLSAEPPEPESTAPSIKGPGPAATPELADAPPLAATRETPADEKPELKSIASSAVSGAIGGVGNAVGGMFRSRRLARRDAEKPGKGQASADTPPQPDEKSRMTVFGARKPAKPKPVVGGKPKYLGLILTAGLMLLLLAAAALAALNEETLSRWFGWSEPAVQTATATEDTDEALPVSEVATAPTPPSDASQQPADDDTLAAVAEQPGVAGVVLSPAEAERIYAATGVWQRAPRIPFLPRSETLDGVAVSTGFATPARIAPGAVPDPNAIGQDSVIPAPVNPPPPGAQFNFGADGLVVATPEGAVTPDGLIVIAGRPPVLPPVRPGTVAPEQTVLDRLTNILPPGATPLTESTDDVVVIAGRPALTPPIRAVPDRLEGPDTSTDTPVSVIFGRPSVLPPIRPGTEASPAEPDAPATTPGAVALSALQPGTVRPRARPASVAAQANAPVLGTLTRSQAAAFRPRARPDGLAPTPELSESTEPEEAANAPQTGLQLSDQIAAAVQEAATRPDPLATATAQAPANSLRPDARPRNIARIIARANEAAASRPAAAAVASPAPPSGPTAGSVAQAATIDNAINLRRLNLIGISGSSGDRRALVRLSNGRFRRVTVGDRLDGGRVQSISTSALVYVKNGRSITLTVGG